MIIDVQIQAKAEVNVCYKQVNWIFCSIKVTKKGNNCQCEVKKPAWSKKPSWCKNPAVRHGLHKAAVIIVYVSLFARDPSKWQVGDVEHLGRLVFALSTKQINSIPLVSLTRVISRLKHLLPAWTYDASLNRQCWTGTWWSRSWRVRGAGGTVWSVRSAAAGAWTRITTDGRLRVSFEGSSKHGTGGPNVKHTQHLKRDQSLQPVRVKLTCVFLWAVPIPSCADIRGTFPSAWTSTQLRRMAAEELTVCVEVLGQDLSLSSEQRRALWVKLRQVRKTPHSKSRTSLSVGF